MSKKDRYVDLSNRVVDLLGGKENISFFTHCMTRLRFNIKDKGLVKEEEIEKIEGVVGTQWSGEQYQLIIGQAVGDAYNLIAQKTGLGEVDSNGPKEKKKFSINTILDAITGSIIPNLPILIGAGFIKIIVVLAEMAGILAPGNPTHTILTFVGDAGFYFLPIFVGNSAAKKFGANPALGMLMGAIFIHPTFVQSVAAGTALSVFGLPVLSVSYTSTVFPVILAVAVMTSIEKFVAKHSPDMLRVLLEPLITILIMLPIALCVLGPIGSYLGVYLSTAVIWFYETVGFFGVGLLAALYPLLVMTGMHTAFIPYVLNTFSTLGFEAFFTPAAIIACINQGFASLAVGLKSKNKNTKSIGISTSVTAILSGVIEPAMYGVNFKYKKPMYASMIGSLVGGMVAGLGKAAAYAMAGATGLLSLPVFLTSNIGNLVWMLVGTAVGIVITFVLTFIIYKEEGVE